MHISVISRTYFPDVLKKNSTEGKHPATGFTASQFIEFGINFQIWNIDTGDCVKVLTEHAASVRVSISQTDICIFLFNSALSSDTKECNFLYYCSKTEILNICRNYLSQMNIYIEKKTTNYKL